MPLIGSAVTVNSVSAFHLSKVLTKIVYKIFYISEIEICILMELNSKKAKPMQFLE